MHAHAPCETHRHAGAETERSRIAQAVRECFRLRDGFPVSVEQRRATEPGFPPFETRVTFWTGNDLRHQYRIFKPMPQVTGDDLPPWWMKDAIIVSDWPSCDCCG